MGCQIFFSMVLRGALRVAAPLKYMEKDSGLKNPALRCIEVQNAAETLIHLIFNNRIIAISCQSEFPPAS